MCPLNTMNLCRSSKGKPVYTFPCTSRPSGIWKTPCGRYELFPSTLHSRQVSPSHIPSSPSTPPWTFDEAPSWKLRLELLCPALRSCGHSTLKAILRFGPITPLDQGGDFDLEHWCLNLPPPTANITVEPFLQTDIEL